ncbi:MAG: tetratricopeptide repeat protein [Candidatus Riflebacteria bacterium]|nr:tetratricopeptide repeat protein [Candidatus Riflebacteria bacterium]
MNDEVRRSLIDLIGRHGQNLATEPRRVEGLLRDYCGTYKAEIAVLVGAVRERIPTDLLAGNGSLPPRMLTAQLTKRLQENLAVTDDAASWAVESWALALGLTKFQSASQPKIPPHAEPRAQPASNPPPNAAMYKEAVRRKYCARCGADLVEPPPGAGQWCCHYCGAVIRTTSGRIQTPTMEGPPQAEIAKSKPVSKPGMRFCPSCGIQMSVPEVFVPTDVQCPGCGHQFAIKPVSSPSSSPRAQAVGSTPAFSSSPPLGREAEPTAVSPAQAAKRHDSDPLRAPVVTEQAGGNAGASEVGTHRRPRPWAIELICIVGWCGVGWELLLHATGDAPLSTPGVGQIVVSVAVYAMLWSGSRVIRSVLSVFTFIGIVFSAIGVAATATMLFSTSSPQSVGFLALAVLFFAVSSLLRHLLNRPEVKYYCNPAEPYADLVAHSSRKRAMALALPIILVSCFLNLGLIGAAESTKRWAELRACFDNQSGIAAAVEQYNRNGGTRLATLADSDWRALVSGGYLRQAPSLDPGQGAGSIANYALTTQSWNGVACSAHGSIDGNVNGSLGSPPEPTVPDVNAAVAREHRVKLLLQHGQFSEAVVDCRRAIELAPEYGPTHATMGDLHVQLKEPGPAEQEYRKAIQLGPQCIAAHFGLAHLMYAAGRKEDAEVSYRAVLRIDQTHLDARLWLGDTLLCQGKKLDAETEVRELVRRAPKWVDARVLLGCVLHQTARHQEALSEFQEAVRLDPASIVAHRWLAAVLKALGQTEEASREEQKVQELERK